MMILTDPKPGKGSRSSIMDDKGLSADVGQFYERVNLYYPLSFPLKPEQVLVHEFSKKSVKCDF